MYLRMMGALLLPEKFLGISLCTSTEVMASSSCSFASINIAISTVIFIFVKNDAGPSNHNSFSSITKVSIAHAVVAFLHHCGAVLLVSNC